MIPNETYDEFLDDMTHHLADEWRRRFFPCGEKWDIETLYALNDLLDAFFTARKDEQS